MPKFNKQEIGIIGHLDLNVFSGRLLFAGQYKQWLKPNMGFRILGGYSIFNKKYKSIPDFYIASRIKKYDYAHADMFVVGFGVFNQKKAINR